jgi:fatty-acyl-CoA synthase
MQYATARAGVVLVNVNPAYRSHELRYVLQKSRIRALFLRERDARANYRAILEDSRNEEAVPLEHVIWLGEPSWDAMLDSGRDFPPDTTTPRDVANIQYTSGTTGSPKGVLLTHHNLVNNGMSISLALRATEQDRICAPVPLYHCFGSVIGSMVSVVTGAALILPSATRRARTLAAGTDGPPLYGVPTMFIAELTRISTGSISPACAPESWPEHPARSKSCERSPSACTATR